MEEEKKSALYQIKHSSHEIALLSNAIEKAGSEILTHKGAQDYIDRRTTAIVNWQIKLNQEEFLLNQAMQIYFSI
jgi:hypothetical protein